MRADSARPYVSVDPAVHPHQLHAAATLWSLRAALRHLVEAAEQEAKAIAVEQLEAADGLCGWRPMVGGHGRGGHGDPVGGAVLAGEREPRANRYAVLAASTTDTLNWLGDQLHLPPAAGPIDRLQVAVPLLRPGHAATLCRWVNENDQRIRQALNLGPDHWLLPPTTACPACHVRLLYAQTAAPDTAAWTIACGHRCLCAGDDCPCGMPVRAAGVAHIWTADSELARGAFAGDAPTTTTSKEAA